MSSSGSSADLSVGVLATHLCKGQLPPESKSVFRVLGVKPIGEQRTKFRLAVTDSVDKYNKGLIVFEKG